MGLKRRTWVLLTCLALVPAIFIWYPLSLLVGQEVPAAAESTVAAAAESTVADGAEVRPGAAASEPTWMDRVDGVFGKYLVQPMSKVLFFDFWTRDLQLYLLGKQDLNGDGKISRDEAARSAGGGV